MKRSDLKEASWLDTTLSHIENLRERMISGDLKNEEGLHISSSGTASPRLILDKETSLKTLEIFEERTRKRLLELGVDND